MKKLRNALMALAAVFIVMPVLLNNYKFIVNKKDIDKFTKWDLLDVKQIRQKNIFFIDGRFDGFTMGIEPLEARYYCEKSLECGYVPEETVLRLKVFEERNGTHFLKGSVSFSGGMKEYLLDSGVDDGILRSIDGVFAEKVSARAAFDDAVKRKSQSGL